MPEELIVKYCSPTLAGIKTGSIFSCSFDGSDELTYSLSQLNIILRAHGLRVIPLKYCENTGQAIIYIYRPDMLNADISNPRTSGILDRFGYNTDNASLCLVHLSKKLKNADQKSFPHEIGLFLGYPPEDVEGFINNNATGYKILGLWKVYGDVENARKTFERFKICTRNCYRQWRTIGSIKGLIETL